MGEQIVLSRSEHSFETYNLCSKFFLQVFGVFIKNFYFHKSIFLQSIVIYNINILIVLIASFFNQFVSKYLTEKIAEGQAQESNNQNMSIQLMQGYFIMATAFIHSPVYEKEKKIRALLNTRGLSWVVYWLGNFLFDFLVFNINLIIVTNFVAVEAVNEIGWFNIFKLGIGIILFSYCCSFMFEKVKTASTWFSLINIVFGMMVMPMIIFGQNTFLKYF